MNAVTLRLSSEPAMGSIELSESVPGPAIVSIPVSQSDMRAQSMTLDWTRSLYSGRWKWLAVADTEAGKLVSDVGEFEVPTDIVLEGVLNYPNPFKDRTKLRYKLSSAADSVTISIYSASGRLVRKLSGPTAAATGTVEYHDVEWDGRDEAGHAVVNGPYIAKVVAESAGIRREVRVKMVKLK